MFIAVQHDVPHHRCLHCYHDTSSNQLFSIATSTNAFTQRLDQWLKLVAHTGMRRISSWTDKTLALLNLASAHKAAAAARLTSASVGVKTFSGGRRRHRLSCRDASAAATPAAWLFAALSADAAVGSAAGPSIAAPSPLGDFSECCAERETASAAAAPLLA